MGYNGHRYVRNLICLVQHTIELIYFHEGSPFSGLVRFEEVSGLRSSQPDIWSDTEPQTHLIITFVVMIHFKNYCLLYV